VALKLATWQARSALARGTARGLRAIAALERARGGGLVGLLGTGPQAGQLLQWAARHHGAAPFIRCGAEQVSFREMNRRSNRVARHLLRCGLGSGQGVAVLMDSQARLLEVYFACQKLACAYIPVDGRLRGAALARVLNDSAATALVLDHPRAQRVWDLREHLGHAELRFVSTAQAPADFVLPPSMRDYDVLARGDVGDGDELELAGEAPSHGVSCHGPEASWGAPRLRALSMLANALYVRDDVLYTCQPLHQWDAFSLSVLAALWVGMPIQLGRRLSPERFFREAAAAGATVCHAFGDTLQRLLRAPGSPHDRAHRVSRVLGPACPRSDRAAFEARFGARVVPITGAGEPIAPEVWPALAALWAAAR